MKLTVKTLKGAKFEVEVDESQTVQDAKSAIVRIVVFMQQPNHYPPSPFVFV